MILTWSGRKIALVQRRDLALVLRRLKNSFFWLAVVPTFTSDQRTQMSFLDGGLVHPSHR